MRERNVHTSASDEMLMDRFKEGDESAFVELYSRYKRRVYAYCVRMINSAEQADDLFQEVFVRVARKRHRFEAGSFSAWLFAIARNLCLNALRDTVTHVAIEDVAETLHTAADEAEYDQSLEILKEAIDQLPADLRDPLVLRVYSGLSYQEIADLTQTKLATVKVRIFRAKQRLHDILAPYFMDRV